MLVCRFFHYAYEALFVNEFDGLDLDFNPKGFGSFAITGQVIINNYGMDLSMLFANLGILVAWFVFFLACARLGLYATATHGPLLSTALATCCDESVPAADEDSDSPNSDAALRQEKERAATSSEHQAPIR